MFSNFSELPLNISMKLFYTLIKFIITYGSDVWISDYKINLSNTDHYQQRNYNITSLTLLLLKTTGAVLANSVDPDQLASEEAT